jgi:hypothetical protein
LSRAEGGAPKLKNDPAGCRLDVDRGLDYAGPQAVAYDPLTGSVRKCRAWPRGPASSYSDLTHDSRAYSQGISQTVTLTSRRRPLRPSSVGHAEPLLEAEVNTLASRIANQTSQHEMSRRLSSELSYV